MNRKRISTTVDSYILDKIDDYSAETHIPKSRILDEALRDYLLKIRNPQINSIKK